MLKQIAAPDVDDERHARRRRDDVGEVLIGRHAEIDAAWLHAPLQRRNDVLERVFVGDQILGPEIAAGFGKVARQPPEFLIAQAMRQRDGRRRRDSAETSARLPASASTSPRSIRAAGPRDRAITDRSYLVARRPSIRGCGRRERPRAVRRSDRSRCAERPTNEHALLVCRQRGHVRIKRERRPVAEQVLLDVGRVERPHHAPCCRR